MDNLFKIAEAYNVPVKSDDIDAIPLLIKASEAGKELKISFFSSTTQERLIYDSISDEWYARSYLNTDAQGNDNFLLVPCDNPYSKRDRPIFASEAFIMRALAIRTFYALKNGMERQGKTPVEVTITCGFTGEQRGMPLAVTEIDAEIISTKKRIGIKKTNYGAILLMPEVIPKEMNPDHNEQIKDILSACNNGDEKILIAKKTGWTESVTIERHDLGWFWVFKGSLPEKLKEEEVKEKILSELKNFSVNGGADKPIIVELKKLSVYPWRPDDKLIIIFVGNLPKPTEEQANYIVNLLCNDFQKGSMIIGERFVKGEEKKFQVTKIEGEIIIRPEGMPALSNSDEQKLQELVNTLPPGAYAMLELIIP